MGVTHEPPTPAFDSVTEKMAIIGLSCETQPGDQSKVCVGNLAESHGLFPSPFPVTRVGA